ncbi:collagen-like domain-containing protein [Streptomyces celluloflavus]|uniref:hypothetical protein n=1 Tax=Streptomyces celluloflavus TaxID=58344 RepID=UPI00368206D6
MTTPTDTSPLPSSIPTVRVHGRYRGPDGRSLSGTVTFTPPGLLTFPASDLFIAGPVVAALDENGGFSVSLPATDAPDMNPSGWAWTVKENLAGVVGARTFALLLPKNVPDVDLADVAPADPTTPNYVPVPGSQIYTGSGAPAASLGLDNDWYTQYDTRTLLGLTHTTVTMWRKSGGAWAKAGADIHGSQWFVNNTTTPSTDAKPGDLLLRSDSGDIWQRSVSGWGNPVGNLKGPKGDPGAQGVPGVKGDTGAASTVPGPKGDTGAAGTPGSKVYAFASGSEASGVGVPGDFAVRTDTGSVYLYVSGSGWTSKGSIRGPVGPEGPQGVKGDPGAGSVNSVNGSLGPDITITVNGKGAGSPAITLSPADVGAVASSSRGVAGGVATLDDSGKVPAAQLSIPAGAVTTVNGKSGPTVTLVAADVSALATTARGTANGVASLDGSTRLPLAQLPLEVPTDHMWEPSDLGLKAWAFDPAVGMSTPIYPGNATLRVTAVNLKSTQTITKIVWHFGGYAGGMVAGSWGAIYNASGTRVGTTAALTGETVIAGVHNAGGATVSAPLTASASLPAGVYYVAWSFRYNTTAGDGPMMLCADSAFGSPPNVFGLNNIKRYGSIAGTAATSAPASITLSAVENGSNRFWAAIA